MERTLSIIKPDATTRNITGKINSMIEDSGLKIVAQKTGIDTFYDFWNFSVDSTDGPESYRQEGIKFAFQTLKDLFTKDGKFLPANRLAVDAGSL